MNAQQEEALETLQQLIEICRDGQEGFRTAAEAIENDTELKMLLSSFSLQRSKFAGELESLAISMGDHHPEREEASHASALHRGWIQLRSFLAGKGIHAILAECERGETVAKEAYRKAMRLDLPDPVREALGHQRQEIIAAHSTIRALREACDAPQSRNGAAEVWHEMKARTAPLRESASRSMQRKPGGWLLAAVAGGFAIGLVVYLIELRTERRRQTRLQRWLGDQRVLQKGKQHLSNVMEKLPSQWNRRAERGFQKVWKALS